MAQVEENSGSKNANIELNLVPFIDLMSVLITFLLITAVWSQVSMIQLGTSIDANKNDNTQPTDPPPKSDIVLRLDVRGEGFRVVMERETKVIPKKAGEYDMEGVVGILKAFKEKYPDKIDGVLSVQESLQYEMMIKGFDALLMSGFPQVTVLSGGVE
jgi:biopolymer transport protein TolR